MAAPPVAQDTPGLDAVLSLVEELRQTVDSQRAEIAALQGQQPRFVPMKRPQKPQRELYRPPEELKAFALQNMGRGGRAAGSLSVLDDPKVTGQSPPGFAPVFQTGDRVMLNSEAKIHGSDRLWGEIATAGGEGEVLSRMHRSDSWEWKYRVVIPGLTQPQGDGFWEHELLPA